MLLVKQAAFLWEGLTFALFSKAKRPVGTDSAEYFGPAWFQVNLPEMILSEQEKSWDFFLGLRVLVFRTVSGLSHVCLDSEVYHTCELFSHSSISAGWDGDISSAALYTGSPLRTWQNFSVRFLKGLSHSPLFCVWYYNEISSVSSLDFRISSSESAANIM